MERIVPKNGALESEFNSIPGRSYLVESSEDLVNWRALGQVSASAFTTTLNLEPGDAAHEFFRVSTP